MADGAPPIPEDVLEEVQLDRLRETPEPTSNIPRHTFELIEDLHGPSASGAVTHRPTKRVVVISDLHCGSRVGLTPPEWQYDLDTKYGRLQSIYWNFYAETIKSLQPIDVLVVNGDAIDGKADKDGGTGQSTVDRVVQRKMAYRCIRLCAPRKLLMTFGTKYHVAGNGGEDWEEMILDECRDTLDLEWAKIGDNEDLSVNGLLMNFKHKCGSSTIPHGVFTPIAKEKLWNMLWAETGQRKQARIVVRSHVHKVALASAADGQGVWEAFTTPALQGLGSKYGGRECSGLVDFGLTEILVDGNGNFTRRFHLLAPDHSPVVPMEG